MEIKVGNKVMVEHENLKYACGIVAAIYENYNLSTKVYEVKFDGSGNKYILPEEDLRLIEEPNFADENFEIKIDVADNLVVAMLLKNGEEIARGHGHIIHGGDIGIAQAISYACKRIWFELGGNYDDK